MHIDSKNYSIISGLIERGSTEIPDDLDRLWELADSLEDMSCLYKIAQIFSCFLSFLCLDGWYLDQAREAFREYKVCFSQYISDTIQLGDLSTKAQGFLAGGVVNRNVFRQVKQMLFVQTTLQKLVPKFVDEYRFSQEDMIKRTEEFCKRRHFADDEKGLEEQFKKHVFNEKVTEFVVHLIEERRFPSEVINRAHAEYLNAQKEMVMSLDGELKPKYVFSCAAIEADILAICGRLRGVSLPEVLDSEESSSSWDLFHDLQKRLFTEKSFEIPLQHPEHFDQRKWEKAQVSYEQNKQKVLRSLPFLETSSLPKLDFAKFFQGKDRDLVSKFKLFFPLLKISVSEDGSALRVEKPDLLCDIEDRMKDPTLPIVNLYKLGDSELKWEKLQNMHLFETEEVIQCLKETAYQVGRWVQRIYLKQPLYSEHRLTINMVEDNVLHLALINQETSDLPRLTSTAQITLD